MRILYGVTGEGLGHAMRSRVMAEHLRMRGHDVKLVASGRAGAYLRRYHDDVQDISGAALAYTSDGISHLRTAMRAARTLRATIRDSLALYRRAISGFQPDACISDFDSFSHIFGLLFDRPVISLDHQHVIDRCRHDRDVRRVLPRDFRLTRAVVRAKLPRCHHYVVTSFYFPDAKYDRTTLVGPILRPEVTALAPSDSGHVLVYQTSVLSPELVATLHAVRDQRFIAYHRGEPAEAGNVSVRAFDEARFLADLASARAVITNGGFTLMSEALYLGKPVLSIPLRHQGEQELNAAYLTTLGLGTSVRRLDAATLRAFLRTRDPIARIPAGNAHATSTIDHLLDEATR